VLSKLLVALYCFVHGKLRLPGAGWLIRRMVHVAPGLKAYPLRVDGFGTAIVDFRDNAAFGLLNVVLGDYGDDSHLFHWLDSQIRPGDVLWDIGANVGYFALYFARPPHRLKAIHSFEPNPRALRTLQSLFANHPCVSVHPVGLGEHDQQLPMSVAVEGSQLGSLVRTIEGAGTMMVTIRRGDDYQRETGIPAPNIIKIDVEGFEPQVMKGLTATILDKQPLIVLEHIWLSDEQLAHLMPKGYEISFLMPDGSLSKDFATRMQVSNAVLTPNSKPAPSIATAG
jgi:FkbM family methyltransferase